jgi:hypothetical protein
LLGGTEFLDLIRTVFASGPPEVPDPIDTPDLQPEDEDRSISHPPDFQCHYIIDDRFSPDNSSEISDSSEFSQGIGQILASWDDDCRDMSNIRTFDRPAPTYDYDVPSYRGNIRTYFQPNTGVRFYCNDQGQIYDMNVAYINSPVSSEDDEYDPYADFNFYYSDQGQFWDTNVSYVNNPDSSDDDDRNMSNLRTSEFPTPTVGIRFYGNHQGQIWDTNPDPSEDDDEDISGISIPDPSAGTPDVPGTLDPDVKDGKPVPVYFNYWKPISVPPKRNTRVTVKVLEYLARGAARGVYLDNIRQALRGSLTRDTTPPLDQSDDHFRANNNTGRKSVRWVSDGNANILDNVPSGSVILGMCPLPH